MSEQSLTERLVFMQENYYDIQEYLRDYAETSPDKEVRIVNAAINAFSEKGFEATRTKEIAERAGIAEGTIFRYFPNKNSILEHMVPLLIRIMMPRISEPISQILNDYHDAPAKDVLQAILLDRIQMIRDNGKFIKSVLPELIHRAPLMNQMRESVMPVVEHYVSKVVNHGIARGEFSVTLEPKIVMLQLMGFILTYSIFGDCENADETRDVKTYLEYAIKGWNKTCKS
jgi:AcrR family transcriptional regulator